MANIFERFGGWFRDALTPQSRQVFDDQLDDWIAQQQEAAQRQRNEWERNKRTTRAREGAVRRRGTALRGQLKSRSRARPRGGTILTGPLPAPDSIVGGGSMGRTSIIGG